MQRIRFLAAYFAAWIPAAVLYSFMIYRVSPPPRSAEEAAIGGVQSIVVAALLGLAVWWYISRIADRPRPWFVRAAVHAFMAVVYTAAWNAFVLASIYFFAPRPIYDDYLQFGFGWNLLTGVLMYGMVAGAAHALTASKRLRGEREVLARSEALRTRAELSALRAQMNPHFLFNTLHSISALVRSDPRAAENALERLGALLRRLLDVNRLGADQVTLGEEWDIVRDQLQLESLRFGDRLRVIENVESEALDCLIPMFTLQPLVENAIKHGVASRTQPCIVRITARVVMADAGQELLYLEVQDDGPGADRRAAMSATGLGLRAIRQRLMAQYGDQGGVHVETAPGEGFLVRVSVPATLSPATRLPSDESQEPRAATT
jgi:signal transduction histidine kinase